MKKSYLIELIYIFDNELKNIQSNVQLSNMPVPLKKKRLDQLSDAINSWAEVKNLVAAYIDGETEWDLMLETAVKKKADMTKMLKECISEIDKSERQA